MDNGWNGEWKGERAKDSHPHFLARADFSREAWTAPLMTIKSAFIQTLLKAAAADDDVDCKISNAAKSLIGLPCRFFHRFPADAETEAASSLPTESEKRRRTSHFLHPRMTSTPIEALAPAKSDTLSLASAAVVQTGSAPAAVLPHCN